MEEHIEPNEANNQASSSKNSVSVPKWIIVLGAVVIILLLIGAAYFLGTKSSNQSTSTETNLATPTAAQNTQESKISTTPTEAVSIKSFSSQKLPGLSFLGYSLKYPGSWKLSEQRDESVPISTVTLDKQGYTIKIFQAATGGAQCIYEGEMPEGPANDYRTNKYTDVTTDFATLRQTESTNNGEITYSYCQKNKDDGSFGQPTTVGHIAVTTGVANPDSKIVSEIETIIQSLKTL